MTDPNFADLITKSRSEMDNNFASFMAGKLSYGEYQRRQDDIYNRLVEAGAKKHWLESLRDTL